MILEETSRITPILTVSEKEFPLGLIFLRSTFLRNSLISLTPFRRVVNWLGIMLQYMRGYVGFIFGFQKNN